MVALFSFYLANLGVGLRALVYVVCLLLRLLPRTLTNKSNRLFFFGEVRLLRMFKELWLICAGLPPIKKRSQLQKAAGKTEIEK